MSSHLGSHQSESCKSLAYALQFLNPFDDKNLQLLSSEISIKEARNFFFKIYKTTDGNAEKQVIPIISEKSIAWLVDDMPESEKLKLIKRSEFHVAVISSVLFSIKNELGLSYSLLQSRDKDEVFCKIFVDEAWMLRNAIANDYELQFKAKPTRNLRFHQVPPFSASSLIECKDKKGQFNHSQLFKLYNSAGEEYDSASHSQETPSNFTSTDRRRLVMKVLRQRIDLHELKHSGVMIEDFCLHEEKPLNKLKANWATFKAIFSPQPLDEVRTYFAEKVAYYFAWINVYWKCMMFAAAIGLITFIAFFIIKKVETHPEESEVMIGFQIFYAVFLAFWASGFDQVWTREEKRLAWRWGTTYLDQIEDQRPEFKGHYGRDEVSGKNKILPDPKENKFLKKSVSLVVICLFMCVVIVAVGMIFYIRYQLMQSGNKVWAKVVPGFLNFIQITILNMLYEKVMTPLNEWENYETENQHNDNLAFKMFIFKFVNSYAALFYMAFLKVHLEAKNICSVDLAQDGTCGGSWRFEPGCDNCMNDLGFQLSIIFIMNMGKNMFELGVPYLKQKAKIYKENKAINNLGDQNGIRTELYPVEKDSKLEPYETPSNDYMEMIIQFGYVALFGSSAPIVAVLALIEITMEIRVDAWKICHLTKRPDPHRANKLGVWNTIIVTVAYAGAVTNSAVIVFTSKLFPGIVFSKLIIYFILIEHTMLGVMYIVSMYVDDTPNEVKNGLMWSKRKVNGKFLSWNDDNNEQTVEYCSSKGDEAFFVTKSDFKYQES